MSALVQARANAGPRTVLVDMPAAFTANTSYKTALLYDDYHPRDAGYSLMADTWYSAIKDFLALTTDGPSRGARSATLGRGGGTRRRRSRRAWRGVGTPSKKRQIRE